MSTSENPTTHNRPHLTTVIHIDLVGPLPPSQGYTYRVDRFTRWPESQFYHHGKGSRRTIPSTIRGRQFHLASKRFQRNGWTLHSCIRTADISATLRLNFFLLHRPPTNRWTSVRHTRVCSPWCCSETTLRRTIPYYDKHFTIDLNGRVRSLHRITHPNKQYMFQFDYAHTHHPLPVLEVEYIFQHTCLIPWPKALGGEWCSEHFIYVNFCSHAPLPVSVIVSYCAVEFNHAMRYSSLPTITSLHRRCFCLTIHFTLCEILLVTKLRIGNGITCDNGNATMETLRVILRNQISTKTRRQHFIPGKLERWFLSL